MIQSASYAAFAAAVLLSFPISSSGTMVIAKDFAALCAEADLIFVGTVSRTESQWTDDEHQAIETFVTFSDVLSLRGTEDKEVTLRFGGGQVGDVREEIAGVPRFAVGDRGVIFARHDYSLSPIVGFHQGCFHVVETSDGPVVLNAEQYAGFALDGGALALDSHSGPAGEDAPLGAFLERVRQQIELNRRRRE